MAAAADAADVGIILYNTFRTTANVAFKMVERLAELPYLAGLKWATPDIGRMEFEQVWQEMEQYTAGDGYLDKLCMDLVGLGSSRCRPSTRDVRALFRERTREMLLACGVPGVITADTSLAPAADPLSEQPAAAV